MDLDRVDIGLGDNPALVVIDVVRGFTNPDCALGHECPEAVDATVRLLGSFRERGLPIFFTSVVYHNEQQARVFRNRVEALNLLTPDSEWVQLDPRLARRDDEVLIEKRWASGFFGTDLNQRLQDSGVDSLVMCGLTTSGCVRATAVDGLQYDYPVVVASDAVSDRNAEAHAANLFDLRAKYTDVKTTAQIIESLGLISSRGNE